MSDKNWQTFLIAFGFFMVVISPLTPIRLLNVVTGVAMILLGWYLLKKK